MAGARHFPAMGKASLLGAIVLAAALAGCEQVATRTVEYRPQQAGTVDHALCLLGFTAVPLRELITGHHLVDVVLNGRRATFVLDTGANATVLHAPFADMFDVGSGLAAPAGAIGLGGAMRAAQVSIRDLEIGGVQVRQRRIMTADLAQIAGLLAKLSGTRIHGIVGQDVMKEHRAVIDVAKPILYLMARDRDPAPVPAEQCRKQPAAPADDARARP